MCYVSTKTGSAQQRAHDFVIQPTALRPRLIPALGTAEAWGMTDTLTTAMIWSGGVVGALKLFDWLLGSRQKKWLASSAETGWIWLSYQRAGRYTSLIRNRSMQIWFSVLTHAFMVLIVLAFLARVFLGVRLEASLELGHPRLYPFQVWVDVAASLLSTVVVSWRLHPTITSWIAHAETLPQYFGRCAKAFGLSVASALVLLLLQYPIIGFSSPFFTMENPAEVVEAYERLLGGRIGVTVIHAMTATLAAPVMAEWMMLQSILFLSFYWLCMVWLVTGLARIAQFVLLRIVESKDGPVIALSGLLIGVGALAKAMLGK